MTDEWVQKIQGLIDELPDDRFLELLDEMIDAATIAKNARIIEETEDEQ